MYTNIHILYSKYTRFDFLLYVPLIPVVAIHFLSSSLLLPPSLPSSISLTHTYLYSMDDARRTQPPGSILLPLLELRGQSHMDQDPSSRGQGHFWKRLCGIQNDGLLRHGDKTSSCLIIYLPVVKN